MLHEQYEFELFVFPLQEIRYRRLRCCDVSKSIKSLCLRRGDADKVRHRGTQSKTIYENIVLIIKNYWVSMNPCFQIFH